MEYPDTAKLRRSALMDFFEQERQEWLAVGMSEADIFRVHFGENGKGGDYAVWLAERKHSRPEHKYAPGEPVSLEQIGAKIPDHHDGIEAAELSVDFERALSVLTKLQRRYFILFRMQGYSCAEIARHEGKHKVTVLEIVETADKKIKNIITVK